MLKYYFRFLPFEYPIQKLVNNVVERCGTKTKSTTSVFVVNRGKLLLVQKTLKFIKLSIFLEICSRNIQLGVEIQH